MNPNLVTTEIEQNASIITEVTQLPAVNTVVEESKTLQTIVDQDKTPIQTVVEENTSNIVSLINQPTIQVTSVNGKTGDVEVDSEVSEFKPGKYYKRGTLTTYNGSAYIAKNDITPTTFNLADWEGVGGGYDDQPIIDRITALEQKPDKDTIYDDTALKTRVSAVETGKANVDASYTKAESDGKYSPTTHTHAYSSLTGRPVAMSQAEADAGTANSDRLMRANVLKGAVQTHQVQPDWNETSGKGEILNKPDLSVYALRSEINQLSCSANAIRMQASPRALEQSGLRIEAPDPATATVAMGPLMAEAFQNALKVGTDKQQNNWGVVAMGYGTSAIFWKIGRICGFMMNSIVSNYGNGTMGEKIPQKYRPKHATSFPGQCLNSGNFIGGFVIRLASDGAITKVGGTTGHQEYHCSGVYLADNDL